MRNATPQKHSSPFLAGPAAGESHDQMASKSHFLHAGQVFVSGQGESVVLILGSCVAVCIWDRVNAIGGATHYLLPTWDGRGVRSPRHGDVAISVLLQRLLEAGADRGQLRAKIFGGGCLFDSKRDQSSNREHHLGSRNVEVALELLTKARIPVVSTEIGENRGQRIVFHTGSGETLVKIL
jgi:chemotaxis protein CheD